ncbi:MAG: GNAT family N-acetyltransferase [Micromonosporaceae bacterium]|nr:GNAT family N-acetyltransferase [Micromonosporaceae bacterium]
MKITRLSPQLIPGVERLIGMGAPYLRLRGSSDYWLYSQLFSSTCPVALDDGQVLGVVIAFRSQDDPDDVYIQDVVTHPDHRRRGLTRRLLGSVRHQAEEWACRRLYLTSEPENTAAHAAWLAIGFTNMPGDRVDHGVSVIENYKGPGMDRAVYEWLIR